MCHYGGIVVVKKTIIHKVRPNKSAGVWRTQWTQLNLNKDIDGMCVGV